MHFNTSPLVLSSLMITDSDIMCMHTQLLQLCLFETLWTVARQAPCPWDSPGKNTGVGCHDLLQGIFPTQGSNPDLLYCKQILYQLSQREVERGVNYGGAKEVFLQ